jgi:hypothetical protein
VERELVSLMCFVVTLEMIFLDLEVSPLQVFLTRFSLDAMTSTYNS